MAPWPIHFTRRGVIRKIGRGKEKDGLDLLVSRDRKLNISRDEGGKRSSSPISDKQAVVLFGRGNKGESKGLIRRRRIQKGTRFLCGLIKILVPLAPVEC